MPLTRDVNLIIEELLRADLAWLAAEVIEAIELPQPVHVTSGDLVDHPQLAGFQPGLESRWDTWIRTPRLDPASEQEKKPDLNDAEQLVVATDVLRTRLVEPALRLAEAERIAGRIQIVGVVREGETRMSINGRAKQVRFELDDGEVRAPVTAADLPIVGDLARLLLEISGRAPRPRTRDELA